MPLKSLLADQKKLEEGQSRPLTLATLRAVFGSLIARPNPLGRLAVNRLNVVIVGNGAIGSALLDHLKKKPEFNHAF